MQDHYIIPAGRNKASLSCLGDAQLKRLSITSFNAFSHPNNVSGRLFIPAQKPPHRHRYLGGSNLRHPKGFPVSPNPLNPMYICQLNLGPTHYFTKSLRPPSWSQSLLQFPFPNRRHKLCLPNCS